MQQAVDDLTKLVRAVPFLSGVLHRDVSFAAATTKAIQHRLGRVFMGAIVLVPQDDDAKFQRIANSSTSLDSVQIQLQADVACKADVWVF
jgi:hypothetical protein